MKIHYKSTKLEKILTKSQEIKKKHGDKACNKIIKRISELNAADCLSDMPPMARVHTYKPESDEIISIDILKHCQPLRLIIKPYGNNYDIYDYTTITEIEIQEIKKIHS
jgi:hypothetical protein